MSELVGLVVDGAETPAESGETFVSVDPSTGEAVAEVARAQAADVARAAEAAAAAFRSRWRDTPPAERGRVLTRIAELIRARRDELAQVEATDAGIPLSLGRANADVAARYFEFYAGAADKIHGDTIPLGPAFVDFTLREPWGVCGVVVPFNFPSQMVARSVAPALAAGNTVVVKSAEAAPLITVRLARIAAEAGLPPGVLNVVHGFGEAGAALVEHPLVAHVSFTGSVATGQAVMEACARHTKPLTLELGGKSPQIVLDAAYLDEAAAVSCAAMFRTAGQACSAGSRLLVRKDLYPRALEAVLREARALHVGRALDDPDVGPLVSERQLDRVLGFVRRARDEGAELRLGGERLTENGLGGGFFVGPTVFAGASPEMTVVREEVFGPVLAVMPFEDVEEALDLANDSEYGLVAGVWTGDVKAALSLATRLEVGQVFVNTYGSGGGVELPFGGTKRSGFGREKGLEALREYTQVKNVCIKVS